MKSILKKVLLLCYILIIAFILVFGLWINRIITFPWYTGTDKEKPRNIDLEKYKASKKYADFDIFAFEGKEVLDENTEPPYIQYVTQEDSIFILIVNKYGAMKEKKFFRKNGIDSIIFQIEDLTRDKDYQAIYYNYFYKDYYISYSFDEHQQDGQKYIQCYTNFKKVYKDYTYQISFRGDVQNVLDPSLGINSNFQDSIKYELWAIEYYEKITLTDSSYIRHQKIKTNYPNPKIFTIDDVFITEYPLKKLSQNKNYSVFWNEYLGYDRNGGKVIGGLGQ